MQNFERLLRAIYAPQNIYCVHVDKKSEASVISAIKAITACFPNVFIASKTVSVVYAAWPRVQADLNCMADLYNASTKWKYFINLCGQDFPLKTNLEIVRMLGSLKGGNSLESEKMIEGKKWRVTLSHQIVDGKIQVFVLEIFIIWYTAILQNNFAKTSVRFDLGDVTIILIHYFNCLRRQERQRTHLLSKCLFCLEMPTLWLAEDTSAVCWRTTEYWR